jgi:integrase
MATFRKRGSSWHVQVRRSGLPTSSRSFRLKSDAELWARQVEQRLDCGDLPIDRRMLRRTTLGDLLRRYRDTVTPAKRGAAEERYRLKKFLAHPMSSMQIGKLTSVMIADYRDERIKTVQGATVRRELALLQHVLTIAHREWGIPIDVNPVSMISKPPLPEGRRRRLQIGELKRLADGCKRGRTPLLEPVVRLAVETGLRRGELLNIHWQELDLRARTLHVCQSQIKKGPCRGVKRVHFG